MKNRIYTILALLISLSMLVTSCASNNTTSSQTQSESVGDTSDTGSSSEDTSITDTSIPDTSIPDTTDTPEPPEPEVQTVSLLAVGDNLIHGYLITAGKKFGYDKFYHRIKDTISAADIAIINQESCFTYDEKEYSGYPKFASPTDVGIAAIEAGFDVFTLATNHTCDKGKQPMLDTIDFFKGYPEVTTLGLYETKEEYDSVKIIEKNGIKIAFFNYTYGFNQKNPVWWMVDTLSNKERMISQLAYAEENADITVVIPHWGTEYKYTPNSTQISWAQFFSDNGADVIIGHHPHAVQPVMELTGKNGNTTICYYSLGNFISNQSTIKGNVGGMATLTIVKDENGTRVEEYQLIPTTVQAEMVNGVRRYEAMLLSDLTPELLAQSFKFASNTVDDFWDLFETASTSYPAK